MTPRSLLLLLTLVVTSAALVNARTLRGDAVPVATSTGGLASSTSAAAGNSSVVTTTLATQGGTAVANQSATKGQHSKTVIAVGDTVLTVQHDEPAGQTWEAAPACPFSPTASNSVKDKNDRLWGWHQGASCTFKQPVHAVSWESAPACPPSVSPATGVKDLSGRLWGWHANSSCAFKDSALHRKLQQAADSDKEPVMTVSSARPLSDDLPAADNKPTITKTVSKGAQGDDVECTLVSTPDATSKTVYDQLKCEKAGKIGITSFDPVLDAATASPPPAAVNTVETAAQASPSPSPIPASSVANPTSELPASTNQAMSASVNPPQDLASGSAPPASAAPVVGDASVAALEPATNAASPPPLATKETDVLLTSTNRFGFTWRDATVCVDKPSKRTAVQDTMGRLWWQERGVSCAYRSADGSSVQYPGYVQTKWETAVACLGQPTLINSMADAKGRLWGWDERSGDGVSCKFVDAGGKAERRESMLQAIIAVSAAESDELKP